MNFKRNIKYIVILKGKNKKFVYNHKTRMNSMLMQKVKNAKINQSLNFQSEITPEFTLNDQKNSICLTNIKNNNNDLFASNSTTSLNRNNNKNCKYSLYDLRRPLRGGNVAATSNIYNNNSIKTATYVSPNGTLSRVNLHDLNSNIDDNEYELNSLQPLILNGTLIKNQQLNGLRNSRNLANLIGINNNFQSQAQPNNYCSSGRIGVLVNENDCENSNTNFNYLSNENRTHYLMPFDQNEQYDSACLKNMVIFFC